MNRITQPYAEAIAEALGVMGPLARYLERVHFLCGLDPRWVGLHSYTDVDYSSTAHCAYEWNTSDGSTTIVLPNRPEWCPPSILVHELGHALQEVLAARSAGEWWRETVPVTEYATTNPWEAFAEHVQARHYWYGDEQAYASDGATRHLLDELAASV